MRFASLLTLLAMWTLSLRGFLERVVRLALRGTCLRPSCLRPRRTTSGPRMTTWWREPAIGGRGMKKAWLIVFLPACSGSSGAQAGTAVPLLDGGADATSPESGQVTAGGIEEDAQVTCLTLPDGLGSYECFVGGTYHDCISDGTGSVVAACPTELQIGCCTSFPAGYPWSEECFYPTTFNGVPSNAFDTIAAYMNDCGDAGWVDPPSRRLFTLPGPL